jgi:enoyl-CoA hydratase
MGTDIRVAVPNAKFGLQEVKWGLFPAGASTVNLPQQIPYAKAMELLLTGDLISADEACSLGLINRVTSTTEDLMPTAMEIAQCIVANGPLAVRNIRRSVRDCVGRPRVAALAREAELVKIVVDSEDAIEGPKAFMEKREPVFRGR